MNYEVVQPTEHVRHDRHASRENAMGQDSYCQEASKWQNMLPPSAVKQFNAL